MLVIEAVRIQELYDIWILDLSEKRKAVSFFLEIAPAYSTTSDALPYKGLFNVCLNCIRGTMLRQLHISGLTNQITCGLIERGCNSDLRNLPKASIFVLAAFRFNDGNHSF